MDARVDGALRRARRRVGRAWALPAASLLLSAGPAAHASPCDDYRAVLAQRFEAAGVRGYSLELVPADAPVPPGTKVIASCEAGARKFLYRRWGAASKAPEGAASATVASSAAWTARGAAAAPALARASGAVVAAPAAMATAGASTPVPAARVAAPAAALAVAPAVTTLPPALRADPVAAEGVTLARRAGDFATGRWYWIGALALAALGAGLWLWRSRFGVYDKDGLPRGPRL